MTTIDDELSEYYEALLKMYRDGALTRLELYAKIFDELTIENVDALIAKLPEALRRGFGEWARDRYDNDIPASGFLAVRAPPMTDEMLSAIRGWLRRHPPKGTSE